MHMLEEHVVPWLRMWHVGFGLMGEQGAESIHAYAENFPWCSRQGEAAEADDE